MNNDLGMLTVLLIVVGACCGVITWKAASEIYYEKGFIDGKSGNERRRTDRRKVL